MKFKNFMIKSELIELEPNAGAGIWNCIDEVIEFSRANNCTVRFVHNGRQVTITPETTFHDADAQWVSQGDDPA